MDLLYNVVTLPHFSGKLLYGYKMNFRSFSECKKKWNELNELDKSKYIDDSKWIRRIILNGLSPIQCWKYFKNSEISNRQLFYFANYPTQVSMFPDLSEEEILQKCYSKFRNLRRGNRRFLDVLNRRKDLISTN
ncbi:hypothetical protein HWI79_1492 [Cryptosporidium felis]|nr:hypothetical protein HWI79_1492 [Cryptosporidium felis]